MIGRRAIVGLSLLCALFLTALGATSAQAKKGTKTFTCAFVFTGGEFGSAHCNKKGEAWGHLVFNKNTVTTSGNRRTKGELEESEEEESSTVVLTAVIAGINVEIKAEEVTGAGSAENKELEGTWEGTGTETLEYTKLSTNVKGCTIKSPVVVKATVTTKVISEAPEEMGLEYKPVEGTTLGEFTFEGAECALKGLTVKLTGTAIATPGGTPNGSGAILNITPAMSEKTLQLGGKPAKLSQRITRRGENGNALVYTTVP
jgi:hypothetical protein